MGLWGAIKSIGGKALDVASVVPGPWQGVAIGGKVALSALGGKSSGRKASEKAAKQQVASERMARQYREDTLGRIRGTMDPYMNLGRQAMVPLSTLAGRSGPTSHSFLRAVPGMQPNPSFPMQGPPQGPGVPLSTMGKPSMPPGPDGPGFAPGMAPTMQQAVGMQPQIAQAMQRWNLGRGR